MVVWRRPLFVMLLACIAVPVRAQSLSDSTYSFEPWPCPQSSTPADLGYDGTIVYGGKRFAVSSLSLQVTTLDLSRSHVFVGIYETGPREPIDVTAGYVWQLATIYTDCYRVQYIDPLGVPRGWIVVQERTKSGRVAARADTACGGDGSGGTPLAAASYDPYSPDGCEDDGESGGGGCPDGSTPVIDYICVDLWIEGIGWVQWTCDYATIC